MFYVAVLTFVFCTVISFVQCGVVAAFVRVIRPKKRQRRVDAPLPKAAVLLSLRGTDPFLETCIQRLCRLDYPDYTLQIVVDNDNDPVLQDVRRFASQAPEGLVQISILRSPSETCSLKCSAIIQAVQNLDDSVEVVAFVDGDVSVYPDWLCDLVSPLSDESVGVTTGNRWYVPQSHWGSWVRHCWNVGAVVQVWLNEITWAGSMAMTVKTIRNTELLDAWNIALADDAAVHRQIHKHGLKVHFVPQVLMINREETSMHRFHLWVQRQLIFARSCGDGWRLVAVHGLNLATAQVVSLALLIIGAWNRDWNVAMLSGAGLALYLGTSLLAVVTTELAVRRNVAQRSEAIVWNSPLSWLWVAPTMLITQVAYPYALVNAICRNRFDWRGIQYELRGTNDVRMLEYRPYESSPSDTPTDSVL